MNYQPIHKLTRRQFAGAAAGLGAAATLGAAAGESRLERLDYRCNAPVVGTYDDAPDQILGLDLDPADVDGLEDPEVQRDVRGLASSDEGSSLAVI